MGTMVKTYTHVLLVDIHESLLFRKCESDFINNQTSCNSEEQNNLCYKQVKVAIYIHPWDIHKQSRSRSDFAECGV